MSSPRYPILNSKPIDQWSFSELKEDLRRRRIPAKGQKEELLRKLDEALQSEMQIGKDVDVEKVKDLENVDNSGPEVECSSDEVSEDPVADDQPGSVANIIGKVENDSVTVDVDDNILDVIIAAQDRDRDSMLTAETSLSFTEKTVHQSENAAPITEFGTTIPALASRPIPESDPNVLETSEFTPTVTLKKNATSRQATIANSISGDQSSNAEASEDLKICVEDANKINLPEPNNQLSEVILELGSQVISESIPSDSMSIIEKSALKDNLNDDSHLELEAVENEVVPSSSSIPPVGGNLHRLDKEPVKTLVSLEQGNCINSIRQDICKKEEISDTDSSGKLNLDPISCNESMEEDVLKTKHAEANVDVEEAAKMVTDSHVKEKNSSHVVGSGSIRSKISASEQCKIVTIAPDKRRLEDHETDEISEITKRQKQWNSETIKVPDPLLSNFGTSYTSRSSFQSASRRTCSRSDSVLGRDFMKEGIVPPSQKPATTSLRIDKFLRPFTLTAVKELLGKTGSVSDFWMDDIKTHCYVTYLSVEEAVATRNALYNLQWPPNGGNLLVPEFVDPHEVKLRAEPASQAPTPTIPSPTVGKTPKIQQHRTGAPKIQQHWTGAPKVQQHRTGIPREHVNHQQLSPPPLPRAPLLPNPPVWGRLPPTPPLPSKPESPIVTLDALFFKTKAMPMIYYIPLTDEQVAAKLAAKS